MKTNASNVVKIIACDPLTIIYISKRQSDITISWGFIFTKCEVSQK